MLEPRWTVQQGISEMRSKLEEARPDFEQRFARIDQLKRLVTSGALDARLRWTREVAA